MVSSQSKQVMFRKTLLAVAVVTSVTSTGVMAQDQGERVGGSSALLEEVVVTARKKEESLQDVPLSVSAFGSSQIQALKVRDLTSLAVSMPNVALDDVGTTRGTANFSIRGLGINSSIPSIDPTVGVFFDGVYLGTNNGAIFDTFDLERIEVLRGPQGILFGRNVTGGAILINTKPPGDEFEATIKAAVEGGGDGGLNKYLMGSVGGPLSETFAAKVTLYYNEDDGYFKNRYDDKDHGAIEQKMIRPVFVWTPNDSMELTLRWEHSESEGDGPSAQSHVNGLGIKGTPANFDRDSFDFSIDNPGYQNSETDFISAELNWELGEGVLTNIFGYRSSDGDSYSDIDAQPASMFHSRAFLDVEQISNEIRYATSLNDRTQFTSGLYYFKNEIKYHERRELLGALAPAFGLPAGTVMQQQDGGGLYNVDTKAIFAALDYDLSERLTLNTGIRYTREEKDAKIVTLSLNKSGPLAPTGTPCFIMNGSCVYDFVDDKSWNSFSPKLGFTYEIGDDARVYSHWTRGFRSGGYNLRNTAQDVVNLSPGPFGEETVDSFELGYKAQMEGLRLNAAVFLNKIADMQRELNLADASAGVVQVIKNTADADILGFELEASYQLGSSTLLMASLGLIDAKYTKVAYDLNSDGVVNGADKKLDLPRAPELTWAVSVTHDVDVGEWGVMTLRGNYAYRDKVAYTDNNWGYIDEQKILNAGVDFYLASGHWTISLYGNNLLDDVKHGGDTQLPASLGPVPLGGTFSPLAKGRVVGVEAIYNF